MDKNIFLIVGLGNPGIEYQYTRHNMGFQTIDKFAKQIGVDIVKEDFHSLFCKTKYQNQDIILCKPLTYMNLSGQTLIEITHFYKIPIENILIIYDDMDTAVGKLKLKKNGSSGGQKGVESIIQMMKTDQIKRIKIGIGRANIPVVDYVLAKPSKEESVLIESAQNKACQIIESIINKGFEYTLSRYNQ